MITPLLAVYGTTRRGGPHNGRLRGCRFVRQDCIQGRLYSLPTFAAAKIEGEMLIVPVIVDLYEVPSEEILSSIDHFEGYLPEAPDQSLFSRIKTRLIGSDVLVYTYDYRFPLHDDLLIPTGDWINQ